MKTSVVSWMSRAGIARAVLLVAVLALVSCVPFAGRPMPDIRGRETVSPGPTGPVEIVRDKNGIAHITAATRNDAYFGQGYAHAQDRFFQMEFWRRIGQGRLSELFGESVLPSDIYLRTMGFSRIARAEYDAAPVWIREALESYAAGVNAYVADKKPGQLSFEFSLLKVQGVEIEIDPWKPEHSLAWVKVMAQDLGSDLTEELLRLDVIRSVGIEMAKDYFSPYRYDEFPTVLLDEELPVRSSETTASDWLSPALAGLGISMIPQNISSAVIAGRNQARSLGLGYGLGNGSNSWVVSGAHTESGMPILSNDPHLGIQMPSIWYEVSLHYTEPDGHEVEIHGVSFAGVPGVVVGHNSDIAWGLAVGYADEQDLYIERINPNNPDQYLVGDTWRDMEIRVERIDVSKRDEPVFVTVRSTRNGPIVTDHGGYAPYGGFLIEPIQLFPTDMQLSALSLKWTALEPGTTFQSVLQINEAQNFDEFRDGLGLWSGPSLGLVYADVEGNIGYQLPGPIPIRGAGTGALPAPGWDDDYQWQGFIPFDEMPWVENPERGFVVAANNPATSLVYPHTLGYTLVPGYRALRITDLLTALIAEGGLTSEDMAEIQLDTYNLSASEILQAVGEVPIGSIEELLTPEFVLLSEPPEDDEIAERVAAA
ncbi:MAG: penicillin acylase family protein, partial [Spirochaetia bacterium]